MEHETRAERPGEDPDEQEELAASPASASDAEARRQALTLLASIFLIAACGLVYELLIATVSSYLLGSSVTQFSISIGVFIGSMGLGSHLSQRVRSDLLRVFILIEIFLGIVGGISVALLFLSYAAGGLYWLVLYGLLALIGGLTGLELPLLTRILKGYGPLRTTLASALSFDYVGALVGSVLFPLLLLPTLGMMRTAFLIGIVNVAVAGWNIQVFSSRLKRPKAFLGLCGLCGSALVAGFLFSLKIVSVLETNLYQDEVIYTSQTPYQRIVITRWRDDLRLFLDGNLQFSSIDEYRYHESLVHPAMSLPPALENVLILGGGDGLAAREVLKYPEVQRVTLVDIDPQMTGLGGTYPALVRLNRGAMNDPRVRIIHQDAHKFLEEDSRLYEVIISDLPDPNTEALAKLYSLEYYKLVKRHLAASGVFATQSTSPYYARDAFWCIMKTIREAGLAAAPYHAHVPSFGDWGFALASAGEVRFQEIRLRVPAQFLTPESLQGMFVLAKDLGEVSVEVSTLDRPVVLNYYLGSSRKWQ